MTGPGTATHAGIEVRSRMTFVLARGQAREAWTVGVGLADQAQGAWEGRIVAAGPAAPTFRVPDGHWARIPTEVPDAEAALLPLSAVMTDAARRSGVSLGDSILVLGNGFGARLAALAIARRGAVPVVQAGTEAPPAALVLEAGRGFEAAACRSVRPRGTVVLVPGAGSDEFDFYRCLQQTGIRMSGIAPWWELLDGPTFHEALLLARASLAGAGAPPILAPDTPPPGGQTEYLLRWSM